MHLKEDNGKMFVILTKEEFIEISKPYMREGEIKMSQLKALEYYRTYKLREIGVEE